MNMNNTIKLSALSSKVKNLRFQSRYCRPFAQTTYESKQSFSQSREIHLSKEILKDRNAEELNESNNKNVNPVEMSKEWIPPNRPLSGDKGNSDEYAKISSKPNMTTIHVSPPSTQVDDEYNELMDGGQDKSRIMNLEDIDLEKLQKDFITGLNPGLQFTSKSSDLNIEDYIDDDDDDDDQWEDILDDEEDEESPDEGSDFDYEKVFDEDKIIKDIMEDEQFNTEDSDLLDLQMSLIDERFQELKTEYIQSKIIQNEQKGKEKNILQPLKKSKSKGLKDENIDSTLSRDFINEEYSELDEFLKNQNKVLSSTNNDESDSLDEESPDWLKTRRAKLFPSDLMTPEESKIAQHLDGDIPVIKGRLLTSDEIIDCLTSLGAIDTNLVIPDAETLPYLGWDGLIIATGSSYSHIRVLTDAIVRNLRKRDLARKGIVGAKLGSEGGEDRSSARRRQGLPKRMDDSWIAVDCGNYIVHVQDDITRESIDLEGLWSPGERGRAGRELRMVNPNDEDAVDEYIANNPVPDAYTQTLVDLSGDFWGDGQMRGGYGLMGDAGKKRNGGRWTSVLDKKRKFKNRK